MDNSIYSRINFFFTNLNVITILIGYPFITCIVIPLMGNVEGSSRIVTIPFRIFALGITLITLFLNIKKTIKYSVALKLFLLFWVLLLLRMFYDLEIRTDFFIPIPFKIEVWLFAIAICFIPMISLVLSINKIDFNLCLKYIYSATIIILIISYFTSIKDAQPGERIDANIALNTVSFAQVAITTTIISIYQLITKKNSSLAYQILYFFSALLGIYVALKSGSRGPLLALLVVLIFWNSFKEKKLSIAYFKFIFFILIALIFKSFIILFISYISPMTAFRINEAFSGTDLGVQYRNESYFWFINKILENPIWGSQFARLSNGDYPGYAHNIFLDILLGFGIFGLGIFLLVIIRSISIIRTNIIIKSNYWIGLIFMQYFVLLFTSGAYYSEPIFNCAIVLTLLSSNKFKQLISQTSGG